MTDAAHGRRRTSQATVAAIGVVGGLAVLAGGCSSGQSSAASSQPQASPAAASSPVTTGISGADLRALARQYLKIATPANHLLDVENDGYGDNEHDNLAAARKDLLGEIATEHTFDRQILAIRFPAAIEAVARKLVTSNNARVALTAQQARSTSLAQLRSFDKRHAAANAGLEDEVRQIRVLLRLPPPSTS
jgi:hypothetical protein